MRFERIGLPNWDMTPAFEVVVSMPGKFEYTGRQPHIEYYLMTCLPCTGKLPVSTLRGLTMIVDGGTVTVTGNRDWIYFSRVDGEAFVEHAYRYSRRLLQPPLLKPCRKLFLWFHPLLKPCRKLFSGFHPLLKPCHELFSWFHPLLKPCRKLFSWFHPLLKPCHELFSWFHPLLKPCRKLFLWFHRVTMPYRHSDESQNPLALELGARCCHLREETHLTAPRKRENACNGTPRCFVSFLYKF